MHEMNYWVCIFRRENFTSGNRCCSAFPPSSLWSSCLRCSWRAFRWRGHFSLPSPEWTSPGRIFFAIISLVCRWINSRECLKYDKCVPASLGQCWHCIEQRSRSHWERYSGALQEELGTVQDPQTDFLCWRVAAHSDRKDSEADSCRTLSEEGSVENLVV